MLMLMNQSALLLFFSLASSQVDKTFGVGECLAGNPPYCADSSNCCSSSGYCGTGDAWCGAGCQSGPCSGNPPSPTPPSPTPPTGDGNHNYCGNGYADSAKCGVSCYGGTDAPCPTGETCFAGIDTCPLVLAPNATPQPTKSPVVPPTGNPPTGPTVAGGDSRVIAYVGNWQTCPTPEQLDGYTHLVIAFAVSYSYAASQNQCSGSCDIGTSVPLCIGASGNQMAEWQGLGKKVILSMGGAGMGGSWGGDVNNCWDYCFGREDELSTALVTMTDSQGFDGIDLDYEYCYDVAGGQHARNCNQSGTGLYTDLKAQTFLTDMTSMLRQKLDTLGSGYELTHAPMDSDLVSTSEYYKILKAQNANLNFLMPQFYNGNVRPVLDGFSGATSEGRTSASIIYDNIANDIFPNQPEKVVFGFCTSDCGGTGSNANGAQAVKVLQDIKDYNGAEFACNGGAFFWVALNDVGGGWSDPVYKEVSNTTGCSDSGTPNPTSLPSKAPSRGPTSSPTRSPVIEFPGICSDDSDSCSATDLSQCACSANRRNLLKGGEINKLRGKQNLRKLVKKEPSTPPPTAPITPNPTASPVPPTNPPTDSPSKRPTSSPTAPPTSFECTCVLPTTPNPTNAVTPNPTNAVTPNPTPNPTFPTNCVCPDFTQKNTCEGGCGGTCNW
eukprot:CAMPEP_0172313318 /NCGR_PEP_ID=MMETSP1058-20130122/20021_1 /TAXON_ID=83371 /ORGANISM="Detonula confervacea, Strain CCMP 353" /LENGTH=665 /DNA_ID=CAMNT_0013026957 /DNA_START=15 /DNA_END=2009 /DNA_ORIENTATION=+